MTEEQNKDIRRSDILIRGLYMLLFYIAGRFTLFLINFFAFFAFLHHLIFKEVNPQLSDFSRKLGDYLHQVTAYLSYTAEQKPWPFAEWVA